MCNYTYMNKTIKTATLTCILLGSLFFLLSKTKITKSQQASAKDTPLLIIDKKPLLLPSPKALNCVAPVQNHLEVGNNINSKR